MAQSQAAADGAAPSTSAAIKLGSRGEREENEFRCESCGKSWARYGFFVKHVKKEHDINELIASEQKRGEAAGAKKTTRCRFCRGEVLRADFFDHFWRRHVDQGHPDQAKPCLLCKKTLPGAEKLRLHLRLFHFDELLVAPSEFGEDVTKVLL